MKGVKGNNIYNYIEQNKSIIYSSLLALVVVTLFLKKENINSISIILLTVFWLFDLGKNISTVFNELIKHKVLLLNVIYFLVLVYGLLISENQSYAIKVLQRSLPFLILPLVFLRLNKVKVNLNAIKLALIFSAFIASIYCEISNYGQWKWFNSFPAYDFSIYEYFTHHWFTYSVLTQSLDLQPSFFALYILTSMIFILEYILLPLKKKRVYFVISIFLLMYFVFFMFHLSSRIGLVLLLVLLGYYFLKLRLNLKYKTLIFLSSVLLFGYILVNSAFMDRLNELRVTLQENVTDKGDNIVHTKKIRVYTLQAFTNQAPINFLFGRGTGDAQQYLDAFFEEIIRENPGTANAEVKWKFKGSHYHNQFIQTNVETGILGLSALLLIFLVSLKQGIKNKNREHILFILICFLFFLLDSVLMRQKGIVFFIFFNIIFTLNYYRNETIIQPN
jgi:O-antigen ligase